MMNVWMGVEGSIGPGLLEHRIYTRMEESHKDSKMPVEDLCVGFCIVCKV